MWPIREIDRSSERTPCSHDPHHAHYDAHVPRIVVVRYYDGRRMQQTYCMQWLLCQQLVRSDEKCVRARATVAARRACYVGIYGTYIFPLVRSSVLVPTIERKTAGYIQRQQHLSFCPGCFVVVRNADCTRRTIFGWIHSNSPFKKKLECEIGDSF